ncbi:hypothetical protein ONZ45_g2106 [Pleurotus djamor]|nr:hypothetical protein ONZ45_g2106 [Pleurotus djamor]
MASRDRSGSGSSRAGSRYRGGTVFDDDLVVVDPQPPVSPSRPSSILRGSHHRTSSGNGSSGNARALRFNPALAGHHPEEGVELPAPIGLNLRGSASLGSFNRNPSTPEAKEPDSAPAGTTDFTDIPGDNDDIEDDYGQPIHKPSTQKPVLDIQAIEQAIERTAIPNRLRGFSINSSESSFSPIDGDSGDQEQIRQGDSTTASNFPFSLNQPPPSDGTVGISVTQHEPEARLRVPSAGNDEGNRSRGDSVSSASTGTSSQGALTAMATSTPDGLRPIIEPVVYVDDIDSLETTVKIPVNLSSFKEPDGIGHRRTRTPMDINITSISTHAQAEALVQRAQQDILEMGNEDVDSEGLSTGSTGRTPLSAKLAKYGESLALERKLREQMERGEQDAVSSEASPDAAQTSPPLSATHTLPESTPVSLGIQRQYSLEHRHRESRPSARQPQPRRPHTSSGTPEGRRSFTTERGKTHQSSQSASVIDVKPSLVADVRARALSIDAELESPTTPLIETTRSHSLGYPSTSNTSFLPEVIKVNSPPFTSPAVFPDEDLSRTSSLEANDTDCDGISGHSSYASLSSRAPPREVARATKLTKMGFDATASKQPTPPKRFGFRSIFQNLKGK